MSLIAKWVVGTASVGLCWLGVYFGSLDSGSDMDNAVQIANRFQPKKTSAQKNYLNVGAITAIWVNNGEDKVPQEELWAKNNLAAIENSLWDGKRIELSGAKNEVVAFNLVLESAASSATDVRVNFDRLEGPAGYVIRSKKAQGEGVFNWVQRPIELFFVRYLQIRGLSVFNYEHDYDERHVPERFRRPFVGKGKAKPNTGWKDRPHADKHYPEIAVPLEWNETFDIEAQSNQSIWVDIYIPKQAPTGRYVGQLLIRQAKAKIAVPVALQVRDFTLPDVPYSKTMLFVGYADINHRYLGTKYPNDDTQAARMSRLILDRHFQLAHRHRISVIDGNEGPEVWKTDAPRPIWSRRFDGSLFTAENGYAGPGQGQGNHIFSIGTYGHWNWKNADQKTMHQRTDNWAKWFAANQPKVQYFLYLIDEPKLESYPQVERWASWIKSNPGIGRKMPSFSTVPAPQAAEKTPSLDIVCSQASFGITKKWQRAAERYQKAGRRLWMYGSSRPATGSMATEDDGVAPRQLAWAQYKMNIDRWFIWHSTYYNNYQCATGKETNLFRDAMVFGCDSRFDPVAGRTGWNYSNGDGVLFYPGTDRLYPKESYDFNGPIVSLRLKHWRRGIQDVDYINLAAQIDPKAVNKIVMQMIPKTLWEYGVDNPRDPSYVTADISWPTNPDVWEHARARLADIIEKNRRKKKKS